jgi:N-formylglutamate amidohydrolase
MRAREMEMEEAHFSLVEDAESPIVAAALHDGHEVRREVAELLAIGDEQRLREEDPFTARLAEVAPTRLVALRSRFEVDLNRPGELAVYRGPQDAWGLNVWRRPPPERLVHRSLELHAAFYLAAERLLGRVQRRHGRFVVLDVHSYNHRRDGPDKPPADPAANPDANVATESVPPGWRALLDRFVADLRSCDVAGRRLDVRENVRFRGGYFVRWLHRRFPDTACGVAIDFKKTFMDEWTGRLDQAAFEALRTALASTLPGLRDSLREAGWGR